MELQFHARGLGLGENLRNYTEQHLRFSLRRLDEHIRRIRVYVEDVNGPRGGIDKRCRVVAHISPSGTLVIEEMDGHVHEAVDRAAGRLQRSVRRELKRQKARRGSRAKGNSIRYPWCWPSTEGH